MLEETLDIGMLVRDRVQRETLEWQVECRHPTTTIAVAIDGATINPVNGPKF